MHHLIKHLHRVNALRQLADTMALTTAIRELQDWQCRRLWTTHQELSQRPHYHEAMAFFVDELYGPKDFSQRDADLARVIPMLVKVLPEKAIAALDNALYLNALSYDLDMAMVQALAGRSLNRQHYAQAYFAVGRESDRRSQIDGIRELGQRLNEVIQIRGVGMIIRFARKPAELAGLLTLHEFLEQGYLAFKGLGKIEGFITPVVETETAIMQQLLSSPHLSDEDNPLPEMNSRVAHKRVPWSMARFASSSAASSAPPIK